jgi:hypothetical protein
MEDLLFMCAVQLIGFAAVVVPVATAFVILCALSKVAASATLPPAGEA